MLDKIIIKIQSTLSWIGLVLPLLALGVVLSSYMVSAAQPYRGPTLFYFYAALLAALLSRKWSTYLVIFCLPLLPGLSTQAELILNPAVKYFVAYPGVDMVAGLFIGQCARSLYLKENLSAWLKPPPWPLGLGLLVIAVSTVITISRNLWQSASSFSLNGIANNIFRFKHMGRGNDFLPFTDLLVYSFTILLIISIFHTIKNSENKNDIVFKPVVIGLIVSACWGIFQAITAFGLPAYAIEYRSNTLGFSAFGFQPDIHAFAGHMLIGAVGLLGYILTVKQAVFWQRLTYIACVLSWVALFLSKSRASLVLALFFIFIVGLVLAYRKRSLFNKYVYIGILVITSVVAWLTFNGKLWIVDAIRELQAADLTSFEALSRLSVYRLEIFASAVKMFSQFPLMGIGQGNFLHLSSLIDFAGSPWVAKTGGENAHNYFFQTLAELGLVGITSFLIVFIWPVKKTQPFKIVAPAVIAILSIFLGNLYSHSLIIRENLLLLSVFVALLYAQANQLQPVAVWSNARNYIVLIIASSTIGLAIKEVGASYGNPPFIYGSECYKNSTSLDAGWTDGLFVTDLPIGASAIKILIDKNQPDSKSAPLFLNLSIEDKEGTQLISVNSPAESNNEFSIQVNLKDTGFTKEGAKATLKLSKCFTPSNFGLKDDSRKLGVHIKQVLIY
jgi:hypothetical protein